MSNVNDIAAKLFVEMDRLRTSEWDNVYVISFVLDRTDPSPYRTVGLPEQPTV